MRTQMIPGIFRALALCTLACMAMAVAHSAEDDSAVLLEQIRGDDFDARQAAIAKLQAMGEAARPVLEKAAASDDAELRETGAKLLASLRKAVVRLIAYDRDGNPAAGAEADVHVSAADARGQNPEAPRPVVLDKSGRAELVMAPGGPWGASPNWKLWQPGQAAPHTWQMSLAEGVNPVVYTLQHTGELTVRVSDPDGKPVKNAQVSLYNGIRYDAELLDEQLLRWGNNPKASGSANEQGEAKIENAPEGVYQVVIRAEGFASAVLTPRRIREGQTAQASAVLQPSVQGKIQLVLLQADNSPVKSKPVEYVLEPTFEGPHAAELRQSMNTLKQWGGRNRQQNPSTDDKGKLLLENIAPGKYELYYRCDGKTPQHAGPLTLASGQTLDLGELKSAPGGSISGKLTGSDDKAPQWVQATAMPEKEMLESIQEFAVNDWRYMRADLLTIGRANTQKGSYELKDLMPGRYTVILSGQYGVLAYIFGVEVVAEKTTTVADVPLPKPGETKEVKGRVVLPDGKSANGAQVTIVFTNQNGWAANCDNTGAFRFQAGAAQGDPVSLTVRYAGCKHKLVDLTHYEGKLDAVEVQLEKIGHGAVHVKVVDEAGKPLPGANVSPSAGDASRRKTNRNGETDLSGLAAGPRTLSVELDGYYVEDAKVAVEADKETPATVRMHSGFALKGQLILPADTAKDGVSVALYGPQTRYSPITGDGRFKFSGVLPGTFTLFAAGPGLLTREPTLFTLKPGQTEIPEFKLELVRASGIVVNLGKEFDGYTASLQTKGAGSEAQDSKQGAFFVNGMMMGGSFGESRRVITGAVDSDGRLEIWGAAPGAYDLYLLAPTRMYNYYGRSTKTAAITRIVRDLQIPVLKSFKELGTVQPTDVKVEAGTATVTGVIRTDALAPNGSGGNLNVSLKGPAAQSTLSFGFPHEVRAATTAVKAALLGEVPPGLKTPEIGQFFMKNLPPGEYTVSAELSMYRTRTIQRGAGRVFSTTSYDSEKREPQVLKTFTLKEGETLDVGTLNFALPKETQEAKAAEESEGEDQTPAFQP
jgi:hypothetical protein